MMGQQTESDSFLPERFSLVHCEKHSDIFRTRQKKQRELQQLVQNTISPIKCSFRLCFMSLDSIALCINNITGLTLLTRELSGKRLEFLKEVVPKLSRVEEKKLK